MSGLVAIFVGYFVVTLALGLWEARKTRSQADFVLGGGRLPGWMLALSERATGESAWLLLGLSGAVYSEGLSSIWIAVGCLLGICSAWIFLAGTFRREAERYHAMTMPEYFSARYPESAATIRALSTVIIVFFFVFYVAAQFGGAGKTVEQTFGITPWVGQVVSAAVIITYATYGGFMSVVPVDALQSILMIFTLVATPVLLLFKLPHGPTSLFEGFAAARPAVSSLTGGLAGTAAFLLILNNLSWFFGYLGGQPQLNARFMGMKDDEHVRFGRNIAVVWTILAYGGILLTGLCALAIFGPGKVKDQEMILPFTLMELFPWWLAGILLAGAVAAMVSTAQSLLLLAATSISQDLYAGILRRGEKLSDAHVLAVSRGATLAVGVLGLVLALTSRELIYTIVGYAWAGIGCSFGPAVLLSFFWRRSTGRTAVTALCAGLLTTIAWIAFGIEKTVSARVVSFLVAMAAAVLVTLLAEPARDGTRPPPVSPQS